MTKALKLLERAVELIERGAAPSTLLYKVVIVQDSVIVLPACFLPRLVRGHHAALLRLTSEATEILRRRAQPLGGSGPVRLLLI